MFNRAMPRSGVTTSEYKTWIERTAEGRNIKDGIYLVETFYNGQEALKVGMTNDLRGPRPRPLDSADRDENMRVLGVLAVNISPQNANKRALVLEVEATIFNLICERYQMHTMYKEIVTTNANPQRAREEKQDIEATLAGMAVADYAQFSDVYKRLRRKNPQLSVSFQYFSAADIKQQLQGIALLVHRSRSVVRTLGPNSQKWVNLQNADPDSIANSSTFLMNSLPSSARASSSAARLENPSGRGRRAPTLTSSSSSSRNKSSHTASRAPFLTDPLFRLPSQPSQPHYTSFAPLDERNVRYNETQDVLPYTETPYEELPPEVRPLKPEYIDPNAQFKIVRSVAGSGKKMFNIVVTLPSKKNARAETRVAIESYLRSEKRQLRSGQQPPELKTTKGNQIWYSFSDAPHYFRARTQARRHLPIRQALPERRERPATQKSPVRAEDVPRVLFGRQGPAEFTPASRVERVESAPAQKVPTISSPRVKNSFVPEMHEKPDIIRTPTKKNNNSPFPALVEISSSPENSPVTTTPTHHDHRSQQPYSFNLAPTQVMPTQIQQSYSGMIGLPPHSFPSTQIVPTHPSSLEFSQRPTFVQYTPTQRDSVLLPTQMEFSQPRDDISQPYFRSLLSPTQRQFTQPTQIDPPTPATTVLDSDDEENSLLRSRTPRRPQGTYHPISSPISPRRL